jgi:hypothetical protein
LRVDSRPGVNSRDSDGLILGKDSRELIQGTIPETQLLGAKNIPSISRRQAAVRRVIHWQDTL